MPIEIRELIVKATIADNDNRTSATNTQVVDEQHLVQACVEQVLAILNSQKER